MVHIRSYWGGIMNQKVEKVVNNILEKFKTQDIPKAVAYAQFPIPNIPCNQWSLLNQLTVMFSGSIDCRGYRQWLENNRSVKKGAKAIYILVPWVKKEAGSSKEDGSKSTLMGFMAKPVFRVEDTDGEVLKYDNIQLPKHNLLERAEELGVLVKAVPGSYQYYGYFNSSEREIGLATPEEKTFFHELAHVAHEKVKGKLKRGQDPAQEIVAEFVAQVLCQLVGKTLDRHLGNSYSYIENYARKLDCTPYKSVLSLLSEVDKVLKLILQEEG
jgi:hypothetical protein